MKRVKRIIKHCEVCESEIYLRECDLERKGRGRFCSYECKYKSQKGWWSKNKNPRWNGGRRIRGDGYIQIKASNHYSVNEEGYIREHRLVMEKYLRRKLKDDELIHHKNGNVKDNRIENLEITNRAEHKTKYHPEIGMATRFI